MGSVNCRRLADSVKRCDIFTKDLYNVTILVDTHGIVENEKKWLHEWGCIANFPACGGGHLGFPIGIKNTHLVEDLPMIIPGQFGFNYPSGFREEAF